MIPRTLAAVGAGLLPAAALFGMAELAIASTILLSVAVIVRRQRR